MRLAALLICLVGCGRFGFTGHDLPDDDGAIDGATDAGQTGAPGARWMTRLGDPAARMPIAGINGELYAVQGFSGTFTGDGGISLTGSGVVSSALVRYDTKGGVVATSVLDATGFCDLRMLLVDAGGVTLGGYALNQTVMPALGLCATIVNSRQEPIVMHIDTGGVGTVVTHYTADNANAQVWNGAAFADGKLALAGIYGNDLTAGAPLNAAQFDPNAWVARPFDGNPTNAAWVTAMAAPNAVHAGPVAARGTSAFMLGTFAGPATLMGVPVTTVGGFDSWIARVEEDGTFGFLHTIGSMLDEPSFDNNSSLVALPDGGCMVSILAPGDVTYDSQVFPASAGEGLVLHLDASGRLVSGMRLPHVANLAVVGTNVYAAFDVSTPITIGGTVVTPAGNDIVIVVLDASGPAKLVGVLGGAGDQSVRELAMIADDALGIVAVTTGAVQFGSLTFDSGTTQVRAVGVLGL